MTAPAPVFFFSLRSPYSWLAWHDLKTFYPRLLARLTLKPFWEPDAAYQRELGRGGDAFLYTAMSREKHLYILADVKRLANRRGLAVHWPVDKAPIWEIPHLAWYVAEAAGKGRDYIEAISAARWQSGRNICDPATVAEVGDSLGLDGNLLASAHHDPEIRIQGQAALADCIRTGVFGVPYFALGRERFWGLDRLPDFVGALANATPLETAPESPPLTLATPNRAMEDHAGGCG